MLLHIFAAFDHHCQRCQQVKPKRVRPQVELRPLTQDELLAEAARTELDNLRDLEQMVALEEATRKKAMYKRSKYSGPMIRFHSKRVEEVALVSLCTCNRPCVHNLKLTLNTFCLQLGANLPFFCASAELFGSQTFCSGSLGFLTVVLLSLAWLSVSAQPGTSLE